MEANIFSFFFFNSFFKLEDYYFTILLGFLLPINVNQHYVCIHPFPLELPSHLPPYPNPLRLSQNPGFGFPASYIKLPLAILHMVIYVCWKQWQTLFIFSNVIFLGSKVIADGDCSQEIKRRLLLGRKVMKT